MRALALCLILAAAPAAAQTPEQQAVADCIRSLPSDVLLREGSGSCLPPAAHPPLTRIFPLQAQQSAANEVVRFRLALAGCPAVKPGPKSRTPWRLALASFEHVPPDVPAIRAYIDREFAKRRQDRPPPGGWCEFAKSAYGEFGRKVRNAVVMRDGSSSVRQCVLDGTCSSADTIDVWLY